MMIRWRRDLIAWSFVCATALVVTGCHKDAVPGGSSSPSPDSSDSAFPTSSPTSTASFPAITTSTSVTLNTNGGNISLSSSGLSAILDYTSYTGGTGGAGVSGQFTLTTVAPTLPQVPTGTPIIYGELQLSSAASFSGYFGLASVTLPSSVFVPSSSNVFTETIYDQLNGSQVGSAVTGSINGQTVTFGSPGIGSFLANAGDVYLLVVSYQ